MAKSHPKKHSSPMLVHQSLGPHLHPHSLSYAVKARFTMARANQDRKTKRERERDRKTTSSTNLATSGSIVNPFCANPLCQRWRIRSLGPGIVALTRNRGISLRFPSIVVTLLLPAGAAAQPPPPPPAPAPPSPLACGLVYNWWICKHISPRASDSAP